MIFFFKYDIPFIIFNIKNQFSQYYNYYSFSFAIVNINICT